MIQLTKEEAQQVLEYVECVPDDRLNVEHIDRDALVETLRARLAEPEKEQEPVAVVGGQRKGWTYLKGRIDLAPDTPLYTYPPQREWVGLTDEEIRNEANHHVFDESFFNGAVWARGKIKEKNNG